MINEATVTARSQAYGNPKNFQQLSLGQLTYRGGVPYTCKNCGKTRKNPCNCALGANASKEALQQRFPT